MTEHETHPPRPTRKEVEHALADVDFPLDKEELVQRVSGAGTGEPVVRQLRALPLGTYASADEVLRSVELADQHGR